MIKNKALYIFSSSQNIRTTSFFDTILQTIKNAILYCILFNCIILTNFGFLLESSSAFFSQFVSQLLQCVLLYYDWNCVWYRITNIVNDIGWEFCFSTSIAFGNVTFQKWHPVAILKLLQNISIRNSFARVIEENNYE